MKNASDNFSLIDIDNFTSPLDHLLKQMVKELATQKEEILQTADLIIDIDKEIDLMKTKHINDVIKLKIGGTVFSVKLSDLLSIKDTLFYKLYYFNHNVFNKEFFFDRSPFVFSKILNYIKYKTIDYISLPLQTLKHLKIEAEYYEIHDIIAYFNSRPLELKIIEVNWTDSGRGRKRNTSNILQDLLNMDKSKGYVFFGKSQITFELNYEWRLDKIFFGSLGEMNYQYLNAQACIEISSDKESWNQLYVLPELINNITLVINCNGEKAKYIRFANQNDFGMGYLEIKPI